MVEETNAKTLRRCLVAHLRCLCHCPGWSPGQFLSVSAVNLLRFEASAEVVIRGDVYRFLEPYSVDGVPSWLLLKLRSGLTTVMAASELKRLYDVGDLIRHVSTGEESSPVDRRDLSEADRQRRIARRLFLRKVTGLVGPRGWHVAIPGTHGTRAETPLSRALKQASEELATELGLTVIKGQVRPVSRSTYYEWLKLAGDLSDDSRHLEGGFRKRGRASSIPTETRTLIIKEIQIVLAEHLAQKKVGKPASLTFEKLKSRIEAAIAVANLHLPNSAANHTLPSRATLYRYYSEFPAFDRAVASKGREFARHAFRTAVGYERETRPLGLVQYDETRLPFYLFDSRFGIPLGRPNLCAALDEATSGLVGFNTSFKPFCTGTMLSTFRHGCLMKG